MTLPADAVRREAESLGFAACGIASLEDHPWAAALDRWLAAGHGGTMRYLHRQARKRKRPRLVDTAARVAVVVLDNYFADAPRAPGTLRVARYAQGADYHDAVLRRLAALGGFLRAHGARVTRPYVDTGPVPERELARRAGLGWIGRNTMLIRPGLGSWTFIGSIFTDLDLAPDTPVTDDHCGTCTRCLDACPTGAFIDDRVLDATRCLSYLTIEFKDPIPPPLAASLDGRVFGCDICNEVCPWNVRFAQPTPHPEFAPRTATTTLTADALERMTESEFARAFGDTALVRTGLARLRRNARAATGDRSGTA